MSAAHFAALSTNLEATREFGIEDERTFGFWDWVGGRYSIWSAIGLSLMMAIGPKQFDEFLDGAYAADRHFQKRALCRKYSGADGADWASGIAISGAFATQAILPYDNRLSRFPAYLQQLEMESNGKRVTMNGKPGDL